MALVLVHSDRFAEHAPPAGHAESVARAAVAARVSQRWRAGGVEVLAPRPATAAEVTRNHSPRYVESVAATAGRSVAFDPDTFTSPASFEVALLAAGAVITAVEWALEAAAGDRADTPAGRAGRGAPLRAAFALVRPPGHHAEHDRAMGFCLFNNVAIAARHALAIGARRVAIVDFDVHHGNGTQWSFYDDPRVLFVSTHQYPFYPGTGALGEAGVGAGEGFTVNIPLPAGATDGDYLLAFSEVIDPVVLAFAPDLLLVSAGYDAHVLDPLARMQVTTAGFAHMSEHIRTLGEAAGSLVLSLEGGYNLDALDASLQATIETLSRPAGTAGGRRHAPAGPGRAGLEVGGEPSSRGRAAVEAARAVQRRYWRGI